jgi:hypothetical protein
VAGLTLQSRFAVSLEAIVRASRVAKAATLAALLGIFLAWWRLFGDPGPPVGVREVHGVVTEVQPKTCRVRLETGQDVRVFCTGRMKAGARVVLTARKYSSGEESFALGEAGALEE